MSRFARLRLPLDVFWGPVGSVKKKFLVAFPAGRRDFAGLLTAFCAPFCARQDAKAFFPKRPRPQLEEMPIHGRGAPLNEAGRARDQTQKPFLSRTCQFPMLLMVSGACHHGVGVTCQNSTGSRVALPHFVKIWKLLLSQHIP